MPQFYLGKQRRSPRWRHLATQGSGKSFSMLFYAGCIIEEPAVENPTLVFLADRNDPDDQIFGSASRGRD